jgi:hypothetical protein
MMAPSYVGDFQLEQLSSEEGAVFFGYHDKTPFNKNGDKVLAHLARIKKPSISDECTSIELGYFQKGDNGQFKNHFIKITETTTWSWQQGSMLQWNPACSDRQIYFNDLVKGIYSTQLFDLEYNRIVKTFNRPIYSLSKDGKMAVSLNFSRLARLRLGYGYALLKDENSFDSASAEDGLFLMDLENGKSSLIVSMAEMVKALPHGNREGHYLNHANFSPDGSCIAFFHIWNDTLSRKRKIRLCIYDLNSQTVSLIEDKRLVSHYDWIGSDTLLVTNRDSALKWHYSLYNVNDLSRIDLKTPLKTDGHPMVNPANKNYAITDSIPDKRRDQHLFLMDLQSGSTTEIAAFYSPQFYKGPVRCDLHPRWDRNGKYICLDTIFKGKREISLLNSPVNEIVN